MRTRRARVLLALSTAIVLAATTAGVASAVGDRGGPKSIHVKLTGYQEDPLALSTTGNGRFNAEVDEQRQEIRYSLSYAGLEGTVTPVPHPYRWSRAERRDQRVPVHQPRQRTGRNARPALPPLAGWRARSVPPT